MVTAAVDQEAVEAERQQRRSHLAAAFRLFAQAGFDEGVAGHMTARDPEHTDMFWVNPLGVSFALIRRRDLLLVDHAGRVVEGNGAVNPAAFAIHAQLHAARPDVIAAAHAHSLHGRALSTLGVGILPITQDACAFYDDCALFDDYTGAVLDPAEGRRIAQTLGAAKAVILRNHGLLTVGASVEAAAWWLLTLERTCQVQTLAMAAGEPILIDPARAALTKGQTGTEEIGRLNFGPLYQRIVAEHPDLLD